MSDGKLEEESLLARLRKHNDRLSVETKLWRQQADDPGGFLVSRGKNLACGYLAELRLCRQVIACQRIEIARLQAKEKVR